MTTVSVVIPTHNRWSMLSTALRSARVQQGVDHEVVVVDDGSSDATPRRLAEIAERDDRVRVVRHPQSLGVARARNDGIAESRGDWTAFLDDDDVWAPHKLRAQLRAAGTSSVLVYGTYVALDAALNPIRVVRAPDPARLRERLFRTNPAGGPSTFMVRTDVLRELGGFDERLSALADWDLLIRVADAGPVAVCRDVVVGYVEHGENMMVSRADRISAEFAYLREKHARAASAAGVEFGDLWLLVWEGMLARRQGGRFRAAASYARRALATRAPRDAAKAVGALLGEPLLQRGRRLAGLRAADVGWLDAYRGREPLDRDETRSDGEQREDR